MLLHFWVEVDDLIWRYSGVNLYTSSIQTTAVQRTLYHRFQHAPYAVQRSAPKPKPLPSLTKRPYRPCPLPPTSSLLLYVPGYEPPKKLSIVGPLILTPALC